MNNSTPKSPRHLRNRNVPRPDPKPKVSKKKEAAEKEAALRQAAQFIMVEAEASDNDNDDNIDALSHHSSFVDDSEQPDETLTMYRRLESQYVTTRRPVQNVTDDTGETGAAMASMRIGKLTI